MGDDFMFQLIGKHRDMALAVENPCHLNMAASFIKLKRYVEAIGQCNIVSMLLSQESHLISRIQRLCYSSLDTRKLGL
ncbi:hypothetical protein ACFX2I_039650 [Malus domestica]